MLDAPVTPDFEPMAVTDNAFYVQLGQRLVMQMLDGVIAQAGR
jgi:hypothetical protein